MYRPIPEPNEPWTRIFVVFVSENYYVGNAWDDFDREQSDADWVAVYPSVDGVEPIRTLAIEAVREAIDDVRYLKTLEQRAPELSPEINAARKQSSMASASTSA